MSTHSARGDKRARILESALRVFASKGFFGAKVSDIATDAGVADGTIYLYFKSKDDLLISVFENQMIKVNQMLSEAIAKATTPRAKLGAFVRVYFELVEAHPHATEVITLELRQSEKFMREYSNPRFGEFLKILAGVVDEGQKAGAFRTDLPAPVAARAIFGLLDELSLMWVAGRGDKIDVKRLPGLIEDMLLGGLAHSPERSTP